MRSHITGIAFPDRPDDCGLGGNRRSETIVITSFEHLVIKRVLSVVETGWVDGLIRDVPVVEFFDSGVDGFYFGKVLVGVDLFFDRQHQIGLVVSEGDFGVVSIQRTGGVLFIVSGRAIGRVSIYARNNDRSEVLRAGGVGAADGKKEDGD